MEKLAQPHRITILTVLNGFKVKVGCAEILFTNRDQFLNELQRYLDNPGEVEKEYMEKALYCQGIPENCEPERATGDVEARTPRVTRGVSDFIESGPVNAD